MHISDLEIKNLNFTTAQLSSFNTIEWQDISLTLIIANNKKNFMFSHKIPMHIKSLQLKLESFFDRKLMLTADGLSANLPTKNNSGVGKSGEFLTNLEKGKLTIILHFNFLRPDTAIYQFKQLFKKFGTFLNTGKTDIPVKFFGILSFKINNNTVKAKLTTERENENYVLVVNKEFFQLISWILEENLTDPEVALLSKNPFKVPKLLNIRNIAQVDSEKYQNIQVVPKDAYRHILWSYLLTKEYGAEFAKKVTDAHEEGDIANTEAEHRMDYSNNAVGRQYALSQYNREEILYQILNDPKVIRSWE